MEKAARTNMFLYIGFFFMYFFLLTIFSGEVRHQTSSGAAKRGDEFATGGEVGVLRVTQQWTMLGRLLESLSLCNCVCMGEG